ncbi:MAG: hypothetical protein K2K60_03640 [Clostridia bacterium]|nr:hypothetical protein [Clostridia bacterium]
MENKLGKVFKLGISSAKAALIIILISLCLTLTACDPIRDHFEHEYLSDVVSVELIKYDNPKQKQLFLWVIDHSSQLKPFDNSKVSVLESLDENKISDFIDSLCELDFFSPYYDFDSPKGTCLKLSYSNGDFLIIQSRYIGKFSPNGEIAEYIGSFSNPNTYKSVINEYFQTRI